jgi:hypothetical protein
LRPAEPLASFERFFKPRQRSAQPTVTRKRRSNDIARANDRTNPVTVPIPSDRSTCPARVISQDPQYPYRYQNPSEAYPRSVVHDRARPLRKTPLIFRQTRNPRPHCRRPSTGPAVTSMSHFQRTQSGPPRVCLRLMKQGLQPTHGRPSLNQRRLAVHFESSSQPGKKVRRSR